jgi:hypothetical protein
MLLDSRGAGLRVRRSLKGRSFIDSGTRIDGSGLVSKIGNDESAAFRPKQGMRLIPDDEYAAFASDT